MIITVLNADVILIIVSHSPTGAIANPKIKTRVREDLRQILNGENAGTGVSGLVISGGNCLVRGLVINRFDDPAGPSFPPSTLLENTKMFKSYRDNRGSAGIFISNKRFNFISVWLKTIEKCQ